MKLWSLHMENFDLTSGTVDHSRSDFSQTVPSLLDVCYPKLWKLIDCPSGQVVWCYISKGQTRKRKHEKVLWELDVPETEILAYVDSIVWNRILGIRCTLPISITSKWRQKAIEEYPDDCKGRVACQKKQEEVFWNEKPLTGDWWQSLLLRPDDLHHADPSSIDAIIRHPVCREWVMAHGR